MKTIPLKEAYKLASQRPLEVLQVSIDGPQWIHTQRNPDKPERIPQREIAVMKAKSFDPDAKPADAWILAHAFNVLPEVVEALKKAAEVIRSEYPEHQHVEYGLPEIDATLAKASTVQMP